MSRNFSVHCEHCQSFPDGYYCSCSKTFYRKGKEVQARECWYNALYLEEWKYHPCPYFEGEIRFHTDENGNPYGPNHYAVREIAEPDGEFGPEYIVEVHY